MHKMFLFYLVVLNTWNFHNSKEEQKIIWNKIFFPKIQFTIEIAQVRSILAVKLIYSKYLKTKRRNTSVEKTNSSR